ncbi:myosin-M heavy chain-like isoform X2 [Sycon ciliatum]|uniref:myosin-M heavy chain-like isoform X2 n=1 Tax=Sycon ciliatum TaxID=27933 RepID=UPI0031F7143C
MAFQMKPKTKEEERKLEVAKQESQRKTPVAPDIVERRKLFNSSSGSNSSNAPVRPPPPKPMARGLGSKKDPASDASLATTPGAKKPSAPSRPNAGDGIEGGLILDNSAAAKQSRKSLIFQSAKKSTSSSSMDKEKTKRQTGISTAESGSGRGSSPADTTAPNQNGKADCAEESSGSDDDGVIVDWKDEDSSEFSSIKPSKFGTIVREGDEGRKASSDVVVRMSHIAAQEDDSPLLTSTRQHVTSVPAQPVAAVPTVALPITPVTPVTPVAPTRDVAAATKRQSTKRKAVRKEEIVKVSPISGLPPTVPVPENLEIGLKRFRVCQEIYSTEYSYVKNLEVLVEVYKGALKSVLSGKDLDTIFMNVESIYEFNCELLVELHDRFMKWSDDLTVGDAFTCTAARFNVYSVYCANHRDAEEAVARLKRKNDVNDTLQSAGQDARVSTGLNLQSYLLTPVQRMPRYLLLLQNLLKHTPDTHPDFEMLREAISKLDRITEHVNQQIRELQNQKALSDLRTQVVGLDAHDLPGRKLAKEGQVCLTSIRKLYQCILFNDLIVFALRGESKGKVEIALDLSTVWVHDLDQNDPQTTAQDAIEIYNPDRPYTIYVKTINEKRLWLNEIRSVILSHLKEKNDNLGPPKDMEERTGISEENVGQSAVVRASDIVHRTAKFSYASGELFDGCWLDAMRHGKGEMTWRDRTTYVGEWVENERIGEGTLTYNTADVYSGTWSNNVQCGKGELKLCSGDQYSGQWKNALPQGDGKIEYANGDIFTGAFDRATVNGDGVLKCKNGIEYDGQWLESQFDGEGKFTNRYGDRFEGELVHNCFHGSGIMNYKDGSVYDGIWEKGHRHGYGSFKEANGAEYNGNWRLDQRHGQGWQKAQDGSVYDGMWEYNARHGSGKMRFANGDEYSGLFKHNHVHGRGTMTYADGSVYIGDFKFAQRHGYGVMEYANGGHYDGSWVHDVREGEGSYTYEDETYSGDFAHDRPHGKGMYTHKGSNTCYTGHYVAGKRCGAGVETSPMGKFVGEWKYGMRHGAGKETSTVGTISDGSWHCNQRNGVFTVRSVTGEVSEATYQAGALVDKPNPHDIPTMPILGRTLM